MQKIDCFSWMSFTPVYFFHGWVHVYLFYGQNGSFCNSMCICLTFLHVCLLNSQIDALFILFSRSEYFVLLHYRQKIDWSFFFYPCLLFSQTRNLSTNSVRMFRSVTEYAGIWCVSMSIFSCLSTSFMSVYFFHVLVPCLAFFIERVLRSLTPCGKTTFRHVYVFQRVVPCLSFSRSEYFVLLHQRQEIEGSFMSTFSCLSTFFTQKNSFCKIRIISRQEWKTRHKGTQKNSC